MIILVRNPTLGKQFNKNVLKTESISPHKFKTALKCPLNLQSYALPYISLVSSKSFSQVEWISAWCLKCIALLKAKLAH